MLPSALVVGQPVTRCMLGSVVGLQPSVRTRCTVAGLATGSERKTQSPGRDVKILYRKIWIGFGPLLASCVLIYAACFTTFFL
jgi:hypothetical protein